MSAFEQAMAQVSEALDLMAEASGIEDFTDPPPGRAAGLWRDAATLLNHATNKCTMLGGEAEGRCNAAAEARGEKRCCDCFRWYPPEEMVRQEVESSSKKAREAGRTMVWWVCNTCKEKTIHGGCGREETAPALY